MTKTRADREWAIVRFVAVALVVWFALAAGYTVHESRIGNAAIREERARLDTLRSPGKATLRREWWRDRP